VNFYRGRSKTAHKRPDAGSRSRASCSCFPAAHEEHLTLCGLSRLKLGAPFEVAVVAGLFGYFLRRGSLSGTASSESERISLRRATRDAQLFDAGPISSLRLNFCDHLSIDGSLALSPRRLSLEKADQDLRFLWNG
jgi:hypothetical protein